MIVNENPHVRIGFTQLAPEHLDPCGMSPEKAIHERLLWHVVAHGISKAHDSYLTYGVTMAETIQRLPNPFQGKILQSIIIEPCPGAGQPGYDSDTDQY
jgi:hypothetical protein